MVSQQTKTVAEALLASLKGIARARVDVDATGRIVGVCVAPDGIDDRAAMRNAQSALMAVLGISVDVNTIAIAAAEARPVAAVTPREAERADPDVVALWPAARHNELNEAAQVAFDTLRAAQANFHGFQFDGAELVGINAHQYVLVAVRRASTDARYCGAAPVIDSVGTASARALMNAVGVAAMGSTPPEIRVREEYESA